MQKLFYTVKKIYYFTNYYSLIIEGDECVVT